MSAGDAGELNQRIRIEQRVKGGNTRGETVWTWGPLVTIWAKVTPLRGREFFAASQMQEEATTKFRIRYRTGLDATMRVIWKGEPYDIKAPPMEVDGQRTWVELLCKKGVGDARMT